MSDRQRGGDLVRVLAVDDEKPGRDRLRRLLANDPRVEFAGCCAGGAEALDAVRRAAGERAPVQVLFLDVQMPELDGFGVVAGLLAGGDADMPEVVFVTAHDEYALRAFDAHAVDYLLKPFSDERFDAALDRAVRQVRARQAHAVVSQMRRLLQATVEAQSAVAPAARRPLDRIVVKGGGRVRLLSVEQIAWIEAAGVYVTLHTRDGAAHLHRASIGALADSLDARRFVRLHRSAIVNIDLVNELRQNAHGDYAAVLRDGSEVRVGRRYLGHLRARLGQAF